MMEVYELVEGYLSYSSFLPPPIVYGLVVLLSLVIGSFLNVVIFRGALKGDASLELEISNTIGDYFGSEKKWPMPSYDKLVALDKVTKKRSQCLSCNYQLKWWNNIPVLSYLFQKGRCTNCDVKVSLQYPLVEVGCALISASALMYVFNGRVSLGFLSFVTFAFLGLVIVILDFKYKYIFDRHNAAFFGLSFLTLWLSGAGEHFDLSTVGSAALMLFALHFLVIVPVGVLCKRPSAMGEGDYPLVFVGLVLCGIYSEALYSIGDTYPVFAVYAYLVSSLTLAVAGLRRLIMGKDSDWKEIPLAPALVIYNVFLVAIIIAI